MLDLDKAAKVVAEREQAERDERIRQEAVNAEHIAALEKTAKTFADLARAARAAER